MKKNKRYLLKYTNLFLVKGHLRSVIYDTGRNKYEFITLELYDFFNKYNKKCIDEINNEESLLLEYIVSNDLGFIIEESEIDMFPEIDVKWDDYSIIQNAIFLYDGQSEILRKNLDILTSNHCFCNFYSIIIQKRLSKIEVEEAVKVILHYPTINVEIYIEFHEWMLESKLPLFNTISIGSVYVYKSPFEKKDVKGIFLTQNIQFDNFIDFNYFNPNISTFSESEFHNLYFNKKIIIDENGYIIKSLNNTTPLITDFPLIFGLKIKGKSVIRFELRNLEKIIALLEDINKWNIPKQKIDVCNACEFRNMCVDSCPIEKRLSDSFFRAKECNYNPYIAKWKNEPDYKNLEECGITCNSLEFSINENLLHEAIKLIYEKNNNIITIDNIYN